MRGKGLSASDLGRDASASRISAVQRENSPTPRVFYKDDKVPFRTTSGTLKSKSKANAKKKPKPKGTLFHEFSSDCGDNFAPLDVTTGGESSHRSYLVAKKTWQNARACKEMRYVEVNDSLSYLVFDGHEDEDVEVQYGNDEVMELHYDDLRQAAAYTATQKKVHLDIVELFGGEGGTTKMGIKLSLRGGINFDITTGFDLMNKADVTFLWAYLSWQTPKCVAMAPPCTAFCQWSQRNRLHGASRPTLLRSRVAGMRLSRLCADVARFQMEHGGLSVVEGLAAAKCGGYPSGSRLWTRRVSTR